MSQQNQPFWYKFLHPSNNTGPSLSTLQNLNDSIEVKITTENDLRIENILIEEFKFRGDFLKQVSNDATSTFNLYFLFLGISISGISVTYQLSVKTPGYLQVLAILSLIVFGIGNSLFFVRFISLVHIYERHKAVMNVIREYYITYLQIQLPDIRSVFRISLEYSIPITYGLLLFSIFAIVDSLCFAVAAFLLTELRLHTNYGSLLSLPSFSLPYIIALLTCILVLALHFLSYRFTLYRHLKKIQEII
jgi:hypothetical protein